MAVDVQSALHQAGAVCIGQISPFLKVHGEGTTQKVGRDHPKNGLSAPIRKGLSRVFL